MSGTLYEVWVCVVEVWEYLRRPAVIQNGRVAIGESIQQCFHIKRGSLLMRCTGYILQYECGRDNLSNLGTRGGADHHIIVPTLYFSWIGFVEGTWMRETHAFRISWERFSPPCVKKQNKRQPDMNGIVLTAMNGLVALLPILSQVRVVGCCPVVENSGWIHRKAVARPLLLCSATSQYSSTPSRGRGW